MRPCLGQHAHIAMSPAASVVVPVVYLAATGGKEQFVDTQAFCLGNAPGMHALAAHPVAKAGFLLDDQHLRAKLGHRLGQRRTRNSTADHNQVVVHTRLLCMCGNGAAGAAPRKRVGICGYYCEWWGLSIT